MADLGINLSGPSSSAADYYGSTTAPGTGFEKIAGGIGSIIGSLGTAGSGIGQIINASKANPNDLAYAMNGNPYNIKTAASIPWMTILILGFIGFVLYLMFKK